MNKMNNKKAYNLKGGSYVEYKPIDREKQHRYFSGVINSSDYNYVCCNSRPRNFRREVNAIINSWDFNEQCRSNYNERYTKQFLTGN